MGVARLRQHVEDAKGVEGQKCRTSFVVTPVMIRGWGKDPGGQERCVGPQGLWVRPWYGGLLLLLLTLLPCKPQASPARCPPPLPALLRLNGHPYLEKQQKGLMVKKEVGEVVAGVQLLLSPFLSSLKCELVKDPENRYSFFGVREVFSATTLSQGEECQVYYASTISSSTNMTNDNSKPPTKASEVSSPKKAGGKGAEISRHNLPKITLPLSRQPRLFDDNMVMYFQEVEPLGEESSGVVKHPKTLVTRRSWTAAQED